MDFTLNYTLSENGYIIAQHEGLALLLDTGAPISLGEIPPSVPGVTAKFSLTAIGLSEEEITTMVGRHIDGIIGADVLQVRTLHIDPVQLQFSLMEAQIPYGQGVPAISKNNMPFVGVRFGDQVISTVFDTGAPLGYVLREMTEGLDSERSKHDFCVEEKWFDTDVFELSVEIGEAKDEFEFGVLPESVEREHIERGVPTVIGLGLLNKYSISVGLREKLFRLEPIN